MGDTFAQTVGFDPFGPLANFGVLGFLAAVLIVAVRVLSTQQKQAHDLDRARADRLEEELRQLNKVIQELTTGALTKTTTVMEQVIEAMREDRRSDREDRR